MFLRCLLVVDSVPVRIMRFATPNNCILFKASHAALQWDRAREQLLHDDASAGSVSRRSPDEQVFDDDTSALPPPPPPPSAAAAAAAKVKDRVGWRERVAAGFKIGDW